MKYRIIQFKGKFIPQRKTWYGWAKLFLKPSDGFHSFHDAEDALHGWHTGEQRFSKWLTPKVIKEYDLREFRF